MSCACAAPCIEKEKMGALHRDAVQEVKTSAGVVAQPVLMRRDVGHTEPSHIFYCHAQTDGLPDTGGAHLEFHRCIIANNAIARNLADHVVITHKGPHFSHPVLAAIPPAVNGDHE
jgi:hypothetical protein